MFRSIYFVDNTYVYNLFHNFQIEEFVMMLRIVDFFIRKIMNSYRNYISSLFPSCRSFVRFIVYVCGRSLSYGNLYLQVRSLILNIKITCRLVYPLKFEKKFSNSAADWGMGERGLTEGRAGAGLKRGLPGATGAAGLAGSCLGAGLTGSCLTGATGAEFPTWTCLNSPVEASNTSWVKPEDCWGARVNDEPESMGGVLDPPC